MQPSYSVYANPNSVTLADLDKKNGLDIITTGSDAGGGFATVLLNNGDGTFGPMTAYQVDSVVGSALGLAVGDFNGDGFADVASFSHGNGADRIVVLRNKPDTGTLEAAGQLPLPIGNGDGGIADIATGDFNDDGHPDLAVTSPNNTKVYVALGILGPNAFLTLSQPTAYTTGACTLLAAGDVTKDGKPDLVTALTGNSGVSVLVNSNGAFSSGNPIAAALNPTGVSLANVDMDPNVDLLVASSGNGHLRMLQGNGQGGFAVLFTFPANSLTGLAKIALADLDGDMVPDLLVPNTTNGAGQLSVFYNPGDGSFSKPQVDFQVGSNPAAVAVGDVNGDGFPDAVVANKNAQGSVSVLFGACQ